MQVLDRIHVGENRKYLYGANINATIYNFKVISDIDFYIRFSAGSTFSTFGTFQSTESVETVKSSLGIASTFSKS